jgi:hypothetical protein
MKSIEEFPDITAGLRERLPVFKPGRAEGLIAWGLAQPGARRWLVLRSSAYWDKGMDAAAGGPALNMEQVTELSRKCEATAALDLLRWRIEARDDLAAVAHLDGELFQVKQKDTKEAKEAKETKPNQEGEVAA